MADNRTSALGDLASLVTASHERARAALEAGPPGAEGAVAWLSSHLAAMDCVVHPAVKHALPEGHRRVHELQTCDHLLQQSVLRLDRRITGDVHLADVPLRVFVDDVRGDLQAHVQLEDRAVDDLSRRLSREDEQALAERLTAAMVDGPTRPHPHTPHTPMAALVAHLDAAVDRARDLMDNRTPPTPHAAHPPREPGRWGSYLMGLPYRAGPPRR